MDRLISALWWLCGGVLCGDLLLGALVLVQGVATARQGAGWP